MKYLNLNRTPFLYLTPPRSFRLLKWIQAVRQTVRIISMDHPAGMLRTGDRAIVHFEFLTRPEYIKKGMKLLFREGNTKVGRCRT